MTCRAKRLTTIQRIHLTHHRTLLLAARLLERQYRDRRRPKTRPTDAKVQAALRELEACLAQQGVDIAAAGSARKPRRRKGQR